jgi:hypothetical protein
VNAEKEVEQEDEVDVTDVLEPCYRRVNESNPADDKLAVLGDELYQRYALVQGDTTCVRYTEVRDFDGEVLRKIKHRFHNKYETMLLYRIREKFIWSLTKRSAINDSAIHSYAVSLMIRDHLRIVDRQRILKTIVTRFYVPLKSDIEDVDIQNAPLNIKYQNAVSDTRVEQSWQRFFGLGLRTQPVSQPR